MKPSLGAWIRFQALRLADALSRRGRGPDTRLDLPAGAARPSLWLFVSTIGELNAIAPLLAELEVATRHLQWVILTDRRIYADAYRLRLPAAEIVEIGDHPAEAPRLAALRPPAMLLIAEIPLQPSDAPCRLPYAWLFQAAKEHATVVSVNGWLYGYPSACRIDTVERQLAAHDWLALHDRICVQSSEVRDTLAALGAVPDQICVTGNIKFDALNRDAWSVSSSRSPVLLTSLLEHDRPTVVAGCVTDEDEQSLVLDAFMVLRQRDPDAMLVIAPRHPEQATVMQNLTQALQQRGLTAKARSSHGDCTLAADVAVLVLDTMGELSDFYACADAAHVGRDHNVLEPLAFGTAVTVRPDWVSTYPSYPVFRMLSNEGVLMVHNAATELASSWRHAITTCSRTDRAARVQQLSTRFGGATQRTMLALASLLPAAHTGAETRTGSTA